MYQEIFKQGKIGNITLKNRLVMSPMGTNLAEMDGSPSEDMIFPRTTRSAKVS